ncbi:hypothetical protein V496_08077 [Pseudogymnoascus sp. VKM F-4515 (FW-2607)]|nr:hypothetical protein V496_08077 [Pseudogymnoascus sp. VKM F-4515 (FW-2607)]KFY86926.1 hypothetical protein V498_07337 [Pseudogymnoascus sp. VKM F-4517 (FW-2822)]
MKFHLAQVLALAAVVNAAPPVQDEPSILVAAAYGPVKLTTPPTLQARASLGWISLYTGDGATGDSGIFFNNNKCQTPKKNDAHSSVTMFNCKCHFYQDANCKGPKLGVHTEKNGRGGVSFNWYNTNLKPGQNWDNRISSLICWSY